MGKTEFEQLNPTCKEIVAQKLNYTTVKDSIYDLPLSEVEKDYTAN